MCVLVQGLGSFLRRGIVVELSVNDNQELARSGKQRRMFQPKGAGCARASEMRTQPTYLGRMA